MNIMDRRFVIDCLNEKMAADPDCEAFGVERHRYQLRPPIALAELERLEAQFDVSLPKDYRDFLLNVGNGGAGPGHGLYSLEGALGGHDPTYRHPYYTMPNVRVARPYSRPDNPGFDSTNASDGLLLLCQNGCGYDAFLVVTGQDFGLVWQYFEAAGHHIPLLQNMPKSPVQNGVDEMLPEYDELERAWIRTLLKAPSTEQLTFTDWYRNWLIRKPQIIRHEDIRKLLIDLSDE